MFELLVRSIIIFQKNQYKIIPNYLISSETFEQDFDPHLNQVKIWIVIIYIIRVRSDNNLSVSNI